MWRSFCTVVHWAEEQKKEAYHQRGTMDEPVYLDNNATTRPYPEVLEAMKPCFQRRYGNPSSVHQLGRDARNQLDECRKRVADALNARSPLEIVFVSCATEANALALRGTVSGVDGDRPHLVTSTVEHPSVLETCRTLEEKGRAEVTYVPVDERGCVSVREVRDAIRPSTELVSIMTANNEIGTRQPVEGISEICRERDIRFHTDAVQVPGKLPIDVQSPPVDFLSLSAHKFHGPRGIGVFYRRKENRVEPLLEGGGQEEELRSGTEATALIAGLAEAIERATGNREEVAEQTRRLREQLWTGLQESWGNRVVRHTPEEGSLPNTLNVSFRGRESDALLISLDLEGICVSAGSACDSGAIEMSHVLEAMAISEEVGMGSVRFSLSTFNTEEDIQYTLEVLDRQVDSG